MKVPIRPKRRKSVAPCMRMAGLVVAGGLLLVACAGDGSGGAGGGASSGIPTGGTQIKGGTVTWAESPAQAPDFIYPFMPAKYFSVANTSQFQYLMYRPLFWFGEGPSDVTNFPLSLARIPKYSQRLDAFTITLKHYMWSDGETVTATDVMQWLNIAHAEKSNWATYIPKLGIPDQVARAKIDSRTRLTIQLSVGVNPKWFLYNMLSQITPLPEAWDITRVGAAPGSGRCGSGTYGAASTDAACRAVWSFMVAQAGYSVTSVGANEALDTYATNPLWQIVDGPWRLSAFNPDGKATFVPNPMFSGRTFPLISKFVEMPFANQSSELDALIDGRVTIGYLPLADVPEATQHRGVAAANDPQLTRHYYVIPFYSLSINYIPYNFNSDGDNGTAGAIFHQLYFRQAFQTLVDQVRIIKEVDKGYGVPTYDPEPVAAGSKPIANPYPYDPSRAVKLLASHGWKVVPGSVDTCVRPGKGAGDCGAGVPAGAELNFTLHYATNAVGAAQRFALERAPAWATAGIRVTLSSATSATVTAGTAACRPDPTCTWELASSGDGWVFTPHHYATGEQIFFTGAPFNIGNYSNPVSDDLTEQLEYTNATFLYYKLYLGQQLPVVYQDQPAAGLVEIAKDLRFVAPFNVYESLNPERYYFVN